MKNSFRNFRSRSASPISPQEKSQLEHLSQLAQPFAHMSEAEILLQLQKLSADPSVAQFLKGQNLAELSSKLAPYLSDAQKQKLRSILQRFKP